MTINNNLNDPKDIWEDLLFYGIATLCALILGALFYYFAHRQLLEASPAYGEEVYAQTQIQTPADQTLQIENKWNQLVEFFYKLKAKEDSQALSSDLPPANTTVQEKKKYTPVATLDLPMKPKTADEEKIQNIAAYMQVANKKLTDQQARLLAKSILTWSKEYNLPVGLVTGVMYAESNFKANAVGPAVGGGSRAVGPMQVMWPMHQSLAKTLGVPNKQAMFGDLGVKVGCHLLAGYCKDEQSVIGGLKRYLASLSRVYILEKVMLTWIIIDQLNSSTLSSEEIELAKQTEHQYIRKLIR